MSDLYEQFNPFVLEMLKNNDKFIVKEELGNVVISANPNQNKSNYKKMSHWIEAFSESCKHEDWYKDLYKYLVDAGVIEDLK